MTEVLIANCDKEMGIKPEDLNEMEAGEQSVRCPVVQNKEIKVFILSPNNILCKETSCPFNRR